jgi:sugar O-acyltransferase (sialic acid O-acetyltransferase NeuD family)
VKLATDTSAAVPVLIPLLNPNEPEARVVSLAVASGQEVSAGDLLCTLETTKSASDLFAEAGGYVVGLRFGEGELASAGEILCYLASSPGWTPPEAGSPERESQAAGRPEDAEPEIPPGLRITRPALALARQRNLDLGTLPVGPLVTETMLREMGAANEALPVLSSEFDALAIVVYGGGGHGKSLIDLIRVLGAYRIVGVVDDGLSPLDSVLGLPILGGKEALTALASQGVRLAANAVGGVGNLQIRVKVFQRLAQAGFACPALVHPTAFVEPSARLSPGVQVFPHAYVGSDVRVGFGAIVNTGAVISHDCALGDYVNISPGALIAGAVQIESGVLIGMGVTVNLGVKVGAGARLGNGATVKEDVPPGGIVRAGTVWPK